jgi:heptosyltransferase-2
MKPKSRNLLVVASNWLGDAVMSLPLLGFLSGLPGARVTVLAPGYTARVFWGIDQVHRLVVLAKDGPTRRLWRRMRSLHALGFHGAVLLPPSFSSALTTFLGRVPHRVGFAGDGRGLLLSEALPAGELRREHLSENYLRLGRVLGRRLQLDEGHGGVTPEIKVLGSERDQVKSILESRGAPPRDYAVVVPGATYGETKSWPREKYRGLVERLRAHMPVVLAGGPGERRLCEVVAEGLKGVYNLAGLTTLGELFALLEGGRVLVANDSGAPHAAASLGTPVVVIFGSTSPTWTRPLGDLVRVVRQPVHCAPCFRKKCPTRLECYQGISTDDVFAETISAIDRTAGSSGVHARPS